MAPQSTLIRGLVLLLTLASSSCVGLARGARDGSAPHISELAEQGDPRHRASQRLVIEGLDADAQGDWARARGRYERALQIDPSNPWAYLALARHYVELGEPGPALAQLDQADAFFEARGPGSPRAEVHRIGLRGEALELTASRNESRALLEEAARRAPEVWGDGRLTADELR